MLQPDVLVQGHMRCCVGRREWRIKPRRGSFTAPRAAMAVNGLPAIVHEPGHGLAGTGVALYADSPILRREDQLHCFPLAFGQAAVVEHRSDPQLRMTGLDAPRPRSMSAVVSLLGSQRIAQDERVRGM